MANTIEITSKMHEMITCTANARSAWTRGCTLYALDLLDSIKERAAYEGRLPKDRAELHAWALNGARDWHEYSDGGCSLVYDGDIAERLCAPYELRHTRGGERRPNSRETWLDVQAHALRRAEGMLQTAYLAATAAD